MEVLEKQEQQEQLKSDEYQQKCIDAQEGKYLVLAGPGTGKTNTLAQRIKKIIKDEKTEPNRILCLTYTDAAANEMLDKIRDSFAKDKGENSLKPENIDVNVFTFHSFCMNIIKRHHNEFEAIGESKVISSAITRFFIKQIIDETPLKFYVSSSGNSYNYIKDIIKGIDEIKKHNISDEKFMENLSVWKKELKDMSNHIKSEKMGLKELEKYRNELSNIQIKADEEYQKYLKEWRDAKDATIKREYYQKKGEAKAVADAVTTECSLINDIGKMEELLILHKKYREKMRATKYIDFNDMITEVLSKLQKDSAFAKKIASEYDYIMVDEYQDTNPLQNQIIYALCEEDRCGNLLAVGDDDQTIYSFQGANLNTMSQYLRHFNIKDDNVICFRNNWRYTKNINKVARELSLLQLEVNTFLEEKHKKLLKDTVYIPQCTPLEHIQEFKKYGINKELTPKNEKYGNEEVECIQYENKEHEKTEVVKKIESIIEEMKEKGEVDYRKIAVLCRNNSTLKEYSEILEHKGIPYELKEGKDIFEISASAVLFFYLELLTDINIYSDKFLTYLLCEPFNIDYRDYIKISQKLAHSKNIINTIRSILNNTKKEKKKMKELAKNYKGEPIYKSAIELLQSEEFIEHNKIKKFLDDYNVLSKMKSYTDIKSTILAVADVTGILNYYCIPKSDNDKSKNFTENILGIRKLLSEAEGFERIYKDLDKAPNLCSFVQYMHELIDKGASIPVDKPDYPLNAVQLSTCHSAKGKQYEYVFMPNLMGGTWEASNKSYSDIIPMGNSFNNKLADIEKKFIENAKLMFVGMTRAQRKLYLSYYDENNKSWFIGKLLDREVLKVSPPAHEYDPDDVTLLQNIGYDYRTDLKALIDDKITNIVFSASMLNDYKKCPRKFFYEKILGLTPSSKDSSATSYGKAIHYACEQTVNQALEKGKLLTIDEFYTYFKNMMDILEFSDKSQKKKYLKQGKISIYGSETAPKHESFYKNYFADEDKIKNYCKTEYEFEFEIDSIKFKGFIDRLDKKDDGTYVIYDYKTGEPKKSDIKPNGNHEDYYNQIAFYKYALNKAGVKIDNENITVSDTIFICPDKCENIVLNIPDDIPNNMCEKVKEEYLESAKAIIQQEFTLTNKGAKNSPCKYCSNKALCGLDIKKYLKTPPKKEEK